MDKIDVAVIQTGGTISSTGQIASPNKTKASQIEVKTIEIFASLGLTCHIFYPFAPNIYDSSNISPKEWQILKEQICELQKKGINKFLVLHGTDTMCYTASALFLTLDSCTVVFTGSQRTLNDDDFDGFSNICLAAEFLANGASAQIGVYVAFAGNIIPAPFCHKQNASDLMAFCDTRSNGKETKIAFPCANLDLSKANLDDVEIIRLNPISMPRIDEIKDKKKYFLIFGFGSGNMSCHFRKILVHAFKNIPNAAKPVIIAASTCEAGLKSPTLYETGIAGLSEDGFSVFSQGQFSEEFIITLASMSNQINILQILRL
ncbi:MAG: asparaginase domain-containing protein [Synergistaceae bacterium]|nr:asparaginase domain-containing protein [Synergistaceae bacterium]